MPELPTLLLSRRPRQAGVDWTGARSWLGGAPRLGSTPWPRGKDGRPLHFVAQVDLAEIAAKIDATPFPAKGALAFFIGGGGRGGGGSVIHLSEPYDSTPIFPPTDTPDLTEYGASADWRTDLSGRPLYPFWPLDFTVLDVLPPVAESDDEYGDFVAAQVAAVKRHFVRRQYNLSPGLAFAGPPIPDWWQMAIKLADDLAKASQSAPDVLRQEQHMLDYVVKQLEQARSAGAAEVKKAEASVAMYETSLAKLQRQRPALLAFAAEVLTWVTGRDPWALMTLPEKAHLASLWARNTEFPKFTGYHGIGPVDDLKDKMFKALPAAGTAAFAALPDSVRQLINEKRAPRPQWWHTAIHFAKSLQLAVKIGVPSTFKVKREWLEADRKALDQMRPKGVMALFGRKPQGDSKKVEELEARIASSEARLAELSRLEPLFLRFVQETSAWVEARDPWAFMTDADIEQLHARLKRATTEFKDLASFARTRIEDLETMTLRALATADDRAYATLPEQVRNVINREYLLPPNVWHQMFGRGCEIQGDSSAMREEGYIMILQLTYDDMMHWDFGDNGAYQFWITPEDLAEQNWGAVQMTFECH